GQIRTSSVGAPMAKRGRRGAPGSCRRRRDPVPGGAQPWIVLAPVRVFTGPGWAAGAGGPERHAVPSGHVCPRLGRRAALLRPLGLPDHLDPAHSARADARHLPVELLLAPDDADLPAVLRLSRRERGGVAGEGAEAGGVWLVPVLPR